MSDLAALLDRASAGDHRAVARLISRAERQDRETSDLPPPAVRAHIVGITGPPGAGKSTLTSALVRGLRGQGKRVGVLAVDPSSPRTGGALLGDRIRMQEHALDPEVFLRSMASRGRLGGLAWATPLAVRVLEHAKCDTVLVETVGVGQNEVDVAQLATTTVVVVAPGMGDSIQAAKAGMLECGDVYVVNKSDHPESSRLRRELRAMLSHGAASTGWRPEVACTVATTGEGVDDLLEVLGRHRARCASVAPLSPDLADVEAAALLRLRGAVRAISPDDELLRALADGASAEDAATILLRRLAASPACK